MREPLLETDEQRLVAPDANRVCRYDLAPFRQRPDERHRVACVDVLGRRILMRFLIHAVDVDRCRYGWNR